MQYRREIDGLRSIAVLPVILFHAGFTLFSGGYAGVDVFFVISGYLITTIILQEHEEKRFSLLRFYERRARRILPPLLLVMLCCLPFAWMWMTPSELVSFANSLRAVIVFLSNVLFWRESGYFAPTSEEKPLLHTWSLAVEEQYYLLFPLVLFLIWRFGRTWIAILLGAVFVASLGLAEYASTAMPGANFYLTPTRAWELMAGSLTAVALLRRPIESNGPLSLLGLGLVLASVFVFDEATRWPSLWTLAPVGGTVLIIAFSTPQNIAGKILGSKPLVAIGLISYGAYLWHQPLFAFARLRVMETPSWALMGGLSIASLVLAWLSWKFLETPIRKKRTFLPSWALGTVALLLCVGLIGAGTYGVRAGGFAERFSVPESVYASISRSDRESSCFGFGEIHQVTPWYCQLGRDTPAEAPPKVFVFGDSHSLNFLDALDTLAETKGLSGVFTGTSGCIPFLGIEDLRSPDLAVKCNGLNERVAAEVAATGIKTIILAARWSYYTDNTYGGGMSYIAPPGESKRALDVSRRGFVAGLETTIARYAEMGVRVVLIRQIPHQPYGPNHVYLRAYDRPDVAATVAHMSVTHDTYRQTQAFVDQAFADIAAKYENTVTIVNLEDATCTNTGVCPIGTAEESYYYDDNHLSPTGSLRMTDPLWNALKDAGLAEGMTR